MSSSLEWSRAFALQAHADLLAWELLNRVEELPSCQQLHFLQMTCEKLVKAYLYTRSIDPDKLQSSHAYIAKNLHLIIQDELTFSDINRSKCRWLVQFTKQIAREIELLHPAVEDDGKRPDNCEDPWEDASGLHVPATHQFSGLFALETPNGITILKLIKDAVIRLL